MVITICGSLTFWQEMNEIKEWLLQHNVAEVHIPVRLGGNKRPFKDSTSDEQSGARKIRYNLIKKHHDKIVHSDCILVLNYSKKGIENYIGGNTFLEIGLAFVNDKKIFLYNPIPEMLYKSEIIGMQPIVINGDLNRVLQND